MILANGIYPNAVISMGPNAGRRCSILRLAGCNLQCEDCDQLTTWGPTAVSRQLMADPIIKKFNRPRIIPADVMICGGEPLLQQEDDEFIALVTNLNAGHRVVHVATNGTILPLAWWEDLENPDLVRWRVAPKIFSGAPAQRRLNKQALRFLAHHTDASFKFVCASPVDVDGVRLFCSKHLIDPTRIWVHCPLPMSTTVVRAGFNLSPHIIAPTGVDLAEGA